MECPSALHGGSGEVVGNADCVRESMRLPEVAAARSGRGKCRRRRGMRTMSALGILCVATTLALVGCQRGEQDATTGAAKATTTVDATSTDPPALPRNINVVLPVAKGMISRCVAGSSLDASGTVTDGQTEFENGERISVSMWLLQAPEPLQVAVRFVDSKGKEAAIVRKPATGLRVATLTLEKPLPAGHYKAEGYWGGNIGCELKITVEE
jgi:hypothetical protein